MPQKTLDEAQIETPEELLAKLKTYKARVKYILEQYPQATGDDRILQWRYLKVFYPKVRITYKQFSDLRKMPAPETLSRCRRLLQADNPDLRPTDKTVRKRRARAHTFKSVLGEGIGDD